jgi:acyl carrier protein
MDSIHDIVLHIICEQLDLQPDNISLDDSLMDDLNADSLDLVEIELKIESELKIDTDGDDMNWFDNNITFGELVKYVEDRYKDLEQ